VSVGEVEGEVFCTWFDFDNDGHRYFLVAKPDEPTVSAFAGVRLDDHEGLS
jgi:hypothetical protein